MTGQQIIETSDNRLFRVWDSQHPDLKHCWMGIEVKRVKGGGFADKTKASVLVRKIATKIVQGGQATA